MTRVRKRLSLKRIRSESMIIETFGSDKEDRRTYDVVELAIVIRDGTLLKFSVVGVPHICDPVHSQPISAAKEHISGLDLADSTDPTGMMCSSGPTNTGGWLQGE